MEMWANMRSGQQSKLSSIEARSRWEDQENPVTDFYRQLEMTTYQSIDILA